MDRCVLETEGQVPPAMSELFAEVGQYNIQCSMYVGHLKSSVESLIF